MSIVTKTGDAGSTALMYGRRVSKSDARVEAYGTVDELNASLGMARASSTDPRLRERLLLIQKDLVILMGELATHPDDLPRFDQDGFHRVQSGMTQVLDGWVKEVEAAGMRFSGWAMPGDSSVGAALDLGRTVCRRAERHVCVLQETGRLCNPEIVVYLNRLADLLWLMARREDAAKAG